MASFATVYATQIPSVFDMELTLVWAIMAVFLIATLGLIGAALTAKRDGAGSTAEPGRPRVVQLRRFQRTEEPPLAA